jgi:imidazolonepropionase-like amidohydrolase
MRLRVLAGAGLGSVLALLASAALAGDYTVLTTGRPSGVMTVTGEGAARSVAYSYNDRGRGPDLKETYRIGPDGYPEQVSTKGVDYLKAPVDESFVRTGGKSSWSSQADAGASDAGGFYLTYQSTPEDFAVLLRALLQAPGGRLELLPAGEARVRKVLDKQVTGPAGETETVTLYVVEGLGLTPIPAWLDADNELFFSGVTWSGTIRKGWESSAAAIVAAQDEALRAREREVARTLQRKPAGPLIIRHANLFDARARAMRANMSVVVSGDRIAAVGPDRSISEPDGAEVVDARGRALLPGLWDMHVHIADNSEGPLQLAAGVTSVRDMANDIDELNARRKRFETGELVGPRIFMAGVIEGPGPLAAPTKILASTPEEVVAYVNRYADLGYEQIKLYSSLKPELVPVATKAAHARGLRVSGHIPAGMTAGQAIDAGYDEIQHVNFVMLNFWPDAAGDTNTMKRFSVVGERGAKLDLRSAEVQAFLKKLHDKNIVIDPTVAAFEGMFTAEPRKADPSLAAALSRLPPAVARSAYGGGMAKTDAQRAQYKAAYAKMVAMVGALHQAGVRMVPGTDGFDGFLLEREFELWAGAGIPNADILYAATLGAASVNHHDKQLGSIETGKLADLILVDGDPSKNISDLRKVGWVMKGGTVYDPKALYASVGVR